MSFLGEIKRRKVFQVAAVYAVVAWLIIQVVGFRHGEPSTDFVGRRVLNRGSVHR
jgi:hypothetical protein